ncbi:MAG: hypothetical protein NC124_14655 [Clostridium sp.]|nr:hypothetical protein [Clostridium sp.]
MNKKEDLIMKWYHLGWVADYLQKNHFIKILVSFILMSTIVGTLCWFFFFWGLEYAALVVYFVLSFAGLFWLYKLSAVKKTGIRDNKIYGFFWLKVFVLTACSVGCLFLSGCVFLGINLLLGGDFP